MGNHRSAPGQSHLGNGRVEPTLTRAVTATVMIHLHPGRDSRTGRHREWPHPGGDAGRDPAHRLRRVAPAFGHGPLEPSGTERTSRLQHGGTGCAAVGLLARPTSNSAVSSQALAVAARSPEVRPARPTTRPAHSRCPTRESHNGTVSPRGREAVRGRQRHTTERGDTGRHDQRQHVERSGDCGVGLGGVQQLKRQVHRRKPGGAVDQFSPVAGVRWRPPGAVANVMHQSVRTSRATRAQLSGYPSHLTVAESHERL
jgi:hypothetical protein